MNTDFRFTRPRQRSGHLGGERTDHRPSVAPLDGREEGLPAEHVEARCSAAVACAEQHHPPRSVRRVDEIRVTGVLDRAVRTAMAEDRVRRAALPWTDRRRSPRDGHHVTALCPAFSDEQIPRAFAPEEVRGLRILKTRARPRALGLTYHSAGRVVDATARDSTKP